MKINPDLIQQMPKIANGSTLDNKLLSPSGPAGGEKPGAFANMLTDMLSSTNDQINSAEAQSKAMLAGDSKNIHEVMIALEKANISFRFLTQVRNKAVEAYQEVFRMQL